MSDPAKTRRELAVCRVLGAGALGAGCWLFVFDVRVLNISKPFHSFITGLPFPELIRLPAGIALLVFAVIPVFLFGVRMALRPVTLSELLHR